MSELSAANGARRPRGRRLLRWIGFTVAGTAALILVALLALLALQTPPARRFVERRVTEFLARQDITFVNEGFRYNVFGLGATLRNVRVLSSRLPDAPPFLELDSARFDLSTWQLIRGRYVLESGTVEGVRLHYFVNEDGLSNLPRPPSDPDDPGEPIDYLIADLQVPSASVRYENRQRDVDVVLPSASLTMRGRELADRHDVTIEANGGTARVQQRMVTLDRLAAMLDLGREDVRVDRAELAAEGALVNASGTFGPFDQPIVDMAFQATLDAARAAAVANIADPIGGQVNAEGTVAGAINALEIDGRIRGTALRYRELTDLNVDAAATYQMGTEYLRIPRLDVRGPAGNIAGEGELALGGVGESRLTATVEALNLETLMGSLRLEYRVASRADGRIDGRWPGTNYAAAAGEAHLFLTPTRGNALTSSLPVGGRVDITGNSDRTVATLRNLRAAGAELNGRVTLGNRQTVDGTVRARAANVQSTLNTLETLLGRRRGSLAPVPIVGVLTADGRVRGTTSAPILTLAVDAPGLSAGDAHGINVNGDLTYRRTALAINRIDLVWQGARANASGVMRGDYGFVVDRQEGERRGRFYFSIGEAF